MIETLQAIWPDLVKIVLLLLNILAFAGGANVIIDWVKSKLGLQDGQAKLAAWFLRGLIGVFNAIVVGTLSPESFASWVDLFVLIVTIFMTSEGLYKFRSYRARG